MAASHSPLPLECFVQASPWLFDVAIPCWMEYGVDWQRGGYYDALTRDRANASTIKRLRVTTRQIYVFSQGALAGVPGAEAAAKHGIQFLRTKLRSSDGGFASTCDIDGTIIDETRDLYDLAFSLFAFGHAYSVLQDDQLRIEALSLVRFIRERLTHPRGGFQEALPARLPRRQNPHMHLLEAGLACAEHMGDEAFALLCQDLLDLCQDRFFDVSKGLVYEYFEDDLSAPVATGAAAVVEPGHHFEWVWLFQEAQRILGRSTSGANALAATTLRIGRDTSSGFLFGQLFENGGVADISVRLWPHAEWLKATLASEQAGTPHEAWTALNAFLTPDGLWRETWNGNAKRFEDTPVPASSLYHITSAIMELRRQTMLTP